MSQSKVYNDSEKGSCHCPQKSRWGKIYEVSEAAHKEIIDLLIKVILS